MKTIDIWLKNPVDLGGYPDVIHIDNSMSDSGYIEDVDNEILFFDEMDKATYKAVEDFLENEKYIGNIDETA